MSHSEMCLCNCTWQKAATTMKNSAWVKLMIKKDVAHVWMKCIAKSNEWMPFFNMLLDITTFKREFYLSYPSAVAMSEMQPNTLYQNPSFEINFLLNFGLLNSVKLSSENMSKSGEINVYMCYAYPYTYAYAHYTWIHSFLSTHKHT